MGRDNKPKSVPQHAKEEMDEFLELALLEVISSGQFSTSSRNCIGMTLSEFYEKYILSKEGLDCKYSSFGSTLKWAKAMHKKGLLIVKVDKRSHVARIMSVGSSKSLQPHFKRPSGESSSDATESPCVSTASLTAATLSQLEEKIDTSNIVSNQNGDDDERGEEDRSEFSFAMSQATTTNSVATSAYTFQPTLHAKLRQKCRDINSFEIQKALKHGKPVARFADGKKKLTHQGLTVLTKGKHNHQLISTWREKSGDNAQHEDSQSTIEDIWIKPASETEKLCGHENEKVQLAKGIDSSTAKALDFLLPPSYLEPGRALREEEVESVCEEFFCKKGHSGRGRLREVAFRVCVHETMASPSARFHTRHTRLYCGMVDALMGSKRESPTGKVKTDIVECLQKPGSPRFWTAISPGLKQLRSKQPKLKAKIKQFIAEKGETSDISPLPEVCIHKLCQDDAEVASAAEELTDLVLRLVTACHVVKGEVKLRDGQPHLITVAEYGEEFYQKVKAGNKQVPRGHRYSKKYIVYIVAGFPDSKIDQVAKDIRQIKRQTVVKISKFDANEWKDIHCTTSRVPMLPSTRRVLRVTLDETKESLIAVLCYLAEQVQPEYREYFGLPHSPFGSSQPIMALGNIQEEEDPYLRAQQESTRLELEEIYRKHNPEKLGDLDRLLAKYVGKEDKLLKTVRRKYCT